MGLKISLAVFIGGILSSAVARLLAGEIEAWMPWLVERRINKAVARLPEDQRERFGEEWRSHVNEIPGQIAKVVAALGFSFAAWKMASILKIERSRGLVFDTLKRTVDVFLSVAFLLLLAPMLLIVGLSIKLGSTGPVISREMRTGLNGRQFEYYRFRTTVVDGSKVTALGKFLRKVSFDEFPVFINVLRGDMSLVGPTPKTPRVQELLNEVDPGYRERATIKPGITGWAQVNDTFGMESIVANDTYYFNNRSFKLDLLILVRTMLYSLDHTIILIRTMLYSLTRTIKRLRR